jgi:DNA-binding CsgD family transcriptional regulator
MTSKLLLHTGRHFINPSKVLAMAELTRELQSLYGITHFTYARMSETEVSVLSNRPETVTYYFKNELPLLPSVHPKGDYHKTLGSSFWNIINNNDSAYSQVMRDYNEKFCLGNLAGFYKSDHKFIEMFGFGSKVSSYEACNLYVNYRYELEQFSLQFLDRSAALLLDVYRNSTKLPQSMVPGFKNFSSLDQVSNSLTRSALIRKVDLNAFNWRIFSKRELDCIEHLCFGATAKETAISLGLSQRTVGHYLENIKSKLGCNKKSDILKIILQNKNIG